jgi:type I restriction enzyme S subunit
MEMTATKPTFQKYPAYKDSGEYWMSEIPEHWEIKKLKHIFQEKKKVTNPELPCGSISFGKVVYKDDEKIPESTKASYQEVLAGEYLVNPLNLNYDLISLRIGLSHINVVVSSGYIVLKNTIELNKSYFNYLLHRYDVAYMKLLGSGVRQTISFNHIANSLLVFPPPEEQTAIANFLDDKTSKIDRAIAQKEKMIALLKERKQIIIQNAVTKGLNPNAKMKNSGVEWIGEIPEHWEIEKGKWLYVQEKRPVRNEDEIITCFRDGQVTLRKNRKTEGFTNALKEHGYQGIRVGDLVIHNMDAFAGAIGVSDSNGKSTPVYSVCTPRKHNNVNSHYYAYYLRELARKGYIQALAKGIRERSTDFRFNDFSNLEYALPTLNEQNAIVELIEEQSAKVQKAIALQEMQIAKLKELKSTLIDSAVTGKIKVS